MPWTPSSAKYRDEAFRELIDRGNLAGATSVGKAIAPAGSRLPGSSFHSLRGKPFRGADHWSGRDQFGSCPGFGRALTPGKRGERVVQRFRSGKSRATLSANSLPVPVTEKECPIARGLMTGVGGPILADPHRLAWLLLMALACVGVGILLVVKAMRHWRRPRLDGYRQYDIVKRSEGLSSEQD